MFTLRAMAGLYRLHSIILRLNEKNNVILYEIWVFCAILGGLKVKI